MGGLYGASQVARFQAVQPTAYAKEIFFVLKMTLEFELFGTSGHSATGLNGHHGHLNPKSFKVWDIFG